MGGIELRDGHLFVDREPNDLDELAIRFTSILDDLDASLEHATTATISGATLPIGPLELQIAYKLYLGTQTDFEDAVHLYTLFGESLRGHRLEGWVERLDVHDDYERLERV